DSAARTRRRAHPALLHATAAATRAACRSHWTCAKRDFDGYDRRFRDRHRGRSDNRAGGTRDFRRAAAMKKLGFIGAGNMGQALAKGLVDRKVFKAGEMIASDLDAARRRGFTRATKIAAVRDNLEVVRQAGAIVLAVKPQTIDAVLTEIG